MNAAGRLLATVAGLGRFPIAPGTVGSAVGVAAHLAIADSGPVAQVIVLLVIVMAGTWAAGVTARHVGAKDPGIVVVDEVAGQMLTLLWLGSSLGLVLTGFLLFRALDVTKPWPARRLERLPGGYGIMADDLLVGVYGNVLLRGMMVLWPTLFA